MPDFLNHLFAVLCGQNPDHTWSPGGILLPCCQRCTGLYVGACVATILHFWFKPKLTGRFLEIHGLFLLLMLPFGFHWLPQGPALRAATGVLFGFAVVTFLWLPLRFRSRLVGRAVHCAPRSVEGLQTGLAGCAVMKHVPSAVYAVTLALTLVLLPLLGVLNRKLVACLLSGLACAGVTVLTALIAGNGALCLREAVRLFWRRAKHRTQL